MVEKEDKWSLVTNYYRDLFQSNAGGRAQELLLHVQHKISQEMNSSLILRGRRSNKD